MGFAATETPFRRNGIARFGVFELDLAALKLLRNGREVGLQQQPALLLSELVANAGQLVTREQLKDKFVNCAVRVLPADRVEQLYNAIDGLEKADDAREIAALASLHYKSAARTAMKAAV